MARLAYTMITSLDGYVTDEQRRAPGPPPFPLTNHRAHSRALDFSAGSTYPHLSADGRFVEFSSEATNLVKADTNSAGDLFVRDVTANTTRRVSVSSSGAQANDGSYGENAAISADGGKVAFQSRATNLVEGDTNGYDDVFLRDLYPTN